MTNKTEPAERWLVLDGLAAVPIGSLTLESLALAPARAVFAPGFTAQQCAELPAALARKLGLGGSWTELVKNFARLEKFLAQAKLRMEVDVLNIRDHYPSLVHLHNWRAVSDRLFASGRPLPKRIFTGYDFDWRPFDEWFYERGDHYYTEHIALGPERRQRMRHLWRWRNSLMSISCHFLGDALVDPPSGDGFPAKMYYPFSTTLSSRQHALRTAKALLPELREYLATYRRGWLRVLPFSPQLVVLGGRQGEFSWAVADMRGQAPPNAFAKFALEDQDLSRSAFLELEFDRWCYFRTAAWEDQEEHAAEELFYSTGGTMESYPQGHEVQRRYYVQSGQYQHRELCSSEPLPGFQHIRLRSGAELHVSDLVTIAEYQTFLAESGYRERRKLEAGYNDLELANERDQPQHPVACNYYDALSYTAWLERKTNRPVRMLRIAEYEELHPGAVTQGLWEPRPRCVTFDEVDYRTKTGVTTPFAPERRAGFCEPLPTVKIRGLTFLMAFDFGEWLFACSGEDAAAICTYDLKGIHDHDPVQRDYFPAKSWGKYRGVKIGFRVCYTAVACGVQI